MNTFPYMVFTAGFLLAQTSLSHAHLGHVGELAGHSHWVGIGAVVLAGAIATAIGKLASKDKDEQEDTDPEAAEEAA